MRKLWEEANDATPVGPLLAPLLGVGLILIVRGQRGFCDDAQLSHSFDDHDVNMTFIIPKKSQFLAHTLVLALLATACGSSNDTVSDAPSAATTTSSTQSVEAEDGPPSEPDSSPAGSEAANSSTFAAEVWADNWFAPQFLESEGLGQVVVAAGLESGSEIVDIGSGCEKQHRQISIGCTQAPGDLEPSGSGMLTSRITKSGLSRRTELRALSPSSATLTSYPAKVNASLTMSRSICSLSTTRMRAFV